MTRPRIRTIKPELWADEKVGQVGREARLLFIALITFADDDGRFRALPSAICGHCFPYDLDAGRKLDKWMSELEQVGLVRTYAFRGVAYAHLPGWDKHQRINRKNDSQLPAPPGSSVNGHGEITEPSLKPLRAVNE